MEPHLQYVTYAWLFGSVIAVLAILIPCFVVGWKLKVNKEVCNVRHTGLDEKMERINVILERNAETLTRLSESIVRIETIVTKNFS